VFENIVPMLYIVVQGARSSYTTIAGGVSDISADGSTIISNVGGPGGSFYIIKDGASQLIPLYPGSTNTSASRMSANGAIIVGATRNDIPWKFQNGNYQMLPVPTGYTGGDADAISPDGSVIAGSVLNVSSSNAVLWKNGNADVLVNPIGFIWGWGGGISGDSSTVIGCTDNSSFTTEIPTVWHDGTAITLPMLAGVVKAEAKACLIMDRLFSATRWIVPDGLTARSNGIRHMEHAL
jgi:uncharacterized membrane protein